MTSAASESTSAQVPLSRSSPSSSGTSAAVRVARWSARSSTAAIRQSKTGRDHSAAATSVTRAAVSPG